ncbi:MAG: hypothetical protein IKK63_01420 [Clostridia bacterium]|nr:hypothetical protein [Clostridia bacterium]
MKRVISVFGVLIIIYINIFSAFSFTIDGVDSGTEWDGSSVYKLVDGESNCGVDFGLVKVKFDYETDALNFCFLFSDPNFSSDNIFAGISLSVNGNSPYEITSAEGTSYKNFEPHSYYGSICVNDTKGATCEIRVGFKSGIPKLTECSVRYIDSYGAYSNYYYFKVINESYDEEEILTVSPTADNRDPAYNPDILKSNYYKTSKPKTINQRTVKEKTSRGKTTIKDDYTIKTSPPYSYTGRTKKPTSQKTSETTSVLTSEPIKTTKNKKETVKVYYYEKEVYISKVYISETDTALFIPSSTIISAVSDTVQAAEKYSHEPSEKISLSKGTKYKKAVTCVGLVSFLTLAFIGVYSAKKGIKSNDK